MLKCNELFSIYKKLQYIKKLLLIEKFDKMLCAVKSACQKQKNRIDILFAHTTGGGGMFTADVDCNVSIDRSKLEYIKCYGAPVNSCYDEVLLAKIREKLKNRN
jgi:hypothetical protein